MSRTTLESGVTDASCSRDRADDGDGSCVVDQDSTLKERNGLDAEACGDDAPRVGAAKLAASDSSKALDSSQDKENRETPLRAETVAELSLRLQSTMQDRDDLAERMTQESRQLQEARRREAEALQEV